MFCFDNFPNRIERSTFCFEIKWTKTDSEHVQQKYAKGLFRTQMCTWKMNGARSYEKFKCARNPKQLGLLKHALAFNNEKLRTTEVKESSLAIKNIVSCFSHCFLLCRYILWWIWGSLGITLNSDARVIFKSLIGSAEDKISAVSAS